MVESAIPALRNPTRRRIGSSYTTFIYDGGILMAIAEIVSGIKATWATANIAIDTRDAVKLNEIKLDMSNQLLELYSAAFALVEANAEQSARCRQLEEKIVQLEQKANEKSRYRLVEPYPGTIVYALNDADGTGDPAHHICPACMDNRSMKSIIQFKYKNKVIGTCHECSKEFRFADNPPIDYGGLGKALSRY
jgi:RNase P subunit RPR2